MKLEDFSTNGADSLGKAAADKAAETIHKIAQSAQQQAVEEEKEWG